MVEQVATQFSIATPDFVSWAIGLLDLRGDEWALDAGCGQGAYLGQLHRVLPRGLVVGLDISPEILQVPDEVLAQAGLRTILLQGDVQALPFVDASFDVVLANHLLYHVADLTRTVSELWRVLRRGGLLLATTNGERHMQEFWSLHWTAMADLGLGRPQARALAAAQVSRFSLESGAAILNQFLTVLAIERRTEETITTDEEPLVTYYRQSSTCERVAATFARPSRRPALQDTLAGHLRRHAQAIIHRDGSLRLTKDVGAFVARKDG